MQDALLRKTVISSFAGVGRVTTAALQAAGVSNAFDLMFFLPYRYEDRTVVCPVAGLKPGKRQLVIGTVCGAGLANRGKGLNVVIKDDHNSMLELFFFKTTPSMASLLNTPGNLIEVFGLVAFNAFKGCIYMQHPEFKLVSPEYAAARRMNTQPLPLTPVYHLSAGLTKARLLKLTDQMLQLLKRHPPEELLPEEANTFHLSLAQAVITLHRPLPPPDHHELIPEQLPAFRRLCFEELTAYQLSFILLNRGLKTRPAAALPPAPADTERFLQSLPFTPTRAQLRVFGEISADLNRNEAMSRLVHGDVGSGKTLVAMLSCIQTAASGGQSVLLAPTELLARQHYLNFSRMMADSGYRIKLLYSGLSKTERSSVLQAAADGSAQIIIGTHSLIQPEVNFHCLRLIIIDEQHRFGVDQRSALLAKAPDGMAAHQLLMSATPIPRTMQLALYSDLEVSVIDELPPGRQTVITSVMPDSKRSELAARTAAMCRAGAQAYWICPLIEENEEEGSAAAATQYASLCTALPDLNIGLLHGQMKENEKIAVMDDFKKGIIQILVATTIVEVGVDVPNASIMVIENAQRFGLAQLHQLRGRVGRGAAKSFCILLYQPDHFTPIAEQRLTAMRSSNDGFVIAQKDLELRGPGEVIGTPQSGHGIFRLSDFLRDADLMQGARQCALDISRDADLSARLVERWFPRYLEALKEERSRQEE